MLNDILVGIWSYKEIFDIRAAVEKYSKYRNITYRTSKDYGEIRVFIDECVVKIVFASDFAMKTKGYRGSIMTSVEFIKYLNDLQKEKV